MKYEGSPMIDTKAARQFFLKGDVEAVRYQDPNEPKTTSYSTSIKGLQLRTGQQAVILDHGRTSYVG